MSTAVFEPHTEPQLSPAERQWTEILAELERRQIRVLVAVTYDRRHEPGRRHVIALTNVRHKRFIPGLEEGYQPVPAESAFCAVRSVVRTLQFRMHVARNLARRNRSGLPDCLKCLAFCKSLTKLPVDELQALSRLRKVFQFRVERDAA